MTYTLTPRLEGLGIPNRVQKYPKPKARPLYKGWAHVIRLASHCPLPKNCAPR